MEILRTLAQTVYNDLSPLATSLTKAATSLVSSEPLNDRDGVLFVSKFVKTNQGQDLLSSYRMALFQIKESNKEIVRMGNLCSTRMSAVQQTMNEEYEAVCNFDNFMSRIPQLNDQLDEINKQLGELHKHMLQIELSLAILDTPSSAAPRNDDLSIIDFN